MMLSISELARYGRDTGPTSLGTGIKTQSYLSKKGLFTPSSGMNQVKLFILPSASKAKSPLYGSAMKPAQSTGIFLNKKV